MGSALHRLRPVAVALIAVAFAVGCASTGPPDLPAGHAAPSTAEDAPSDPSGTGAAHDVFCERYLAFFLAGQDYPGAFEPDPDGDGSVFLEQSRALYATGAALLDAAADVAPADIADDVTAMARAWSTASRRADQARRPEDVPTGFLESPELVEASSAVGDHARAHCDMANAVAAADD